MKDEAILLALQNVSAGLSAINAELAANREAMVVMREDMAVLKDRERSHAALEKTLEEFRRRLEALEKRNFKQDGAYTFMTMLRDFGPWVVAIAAWSWTLF